MEILSSGLSRAHPIQTRNCGNGGGASEVPLILWPSKLKPEMPCDPPEIPEAASSSAPQSLAPNSCSEDPSTKAVRGWASCLLGRQTRNKQYQQAHQWTAEGPAAPPLLPASPDPSNSPSRARCPFCVRCHSTRCLRWGPRAGGPRTP